ncbi:MAG: phosphatase PAP2 family protein [Oligoflexales bacterium]|nr:phosphatase PAP2 family protein [Oligoflexales bacterium]
MLRELLEFDKKMFVLINNGLTSDKLDLTMRALSSQEVWGVVAFVCLVVILARKRWELLKLFFIIAIAIMISDFLSYNVLKPYFNRLRPCKELSYVRTLIEVGCGGWQGFPSNHAVNSMIVATFCMIYGSALVGGIVFFLALLVGFSRIYLGVHYPLDVVAGFFIGAISAVFINLLYLKSIKIFSQTIIRR